VEQDGDGKEEGCCPAEVCISEGSMSGSCGFARVIPALGDLLRGTRVFCEAHVICFASKASGGEAQVNSTGDLL